MIFINHWYRHCCIVGLLLFISFTTFAQADLQISLTRVATTFPDDPEGFQTLYIPIYTNGYYAFIGAGHGATSLGIFANLNGYLQNIITNQTAIPDGGGSFERFGQKITQPLSLWQNTLAFLGEGRFSQVGLYRYQNKRLSLIANQATPIPEGHGNFVTFGQPALLADGSVGFDAIGPENQAGIYLSDPYGRLQAIVNTATSLPYDTGNFTHFSLARFTPTSTSDDPQLVFIGKGSRGQIGIYQYQHHTLHIIANENTALPGPDTGFFSHFIALSTDSDNNAVAFIGGGPFNQIGVYYSDADAHRLQIIANTQTFIPHGISTFVRFSEVSVSDHVIAFHGSGQNQQAGIYLATNGNIFKVLSNKDKVDGKTIKNITISAQSLNHNHLALLVNFTDKTQAIYIATLAIANT